MSNFKFYFPIRLFLGVSFLASIAFQWSVVTYASDSSSDSLERHIPHHSDSILVQDFPHIEREKFVDDLRSSILGEFSGSLYRFETDLTIGAIFERFLKMSGVLSTVLESWSHTIPSTSDTHRLKVFKEFLDRVIVRFKPSSLRRAELLKAIEKGIRKFDGNFVFTDQFKRRRFYESDWRHRSVLKLLVASFNGFFGELNVLLRVPDLQAANVLATDISGEWSAEIIERILKKYGDGEMLSKMLSREIDLVYIEDNQLTWGEVKSNYRPLDTLGRSFDKNLNQVIRWQNLGADLELYPRIVLYLLGGVTERAKQEIESKGIIVMGKVFPNPISQQPKCQAALEGNSGQSLSTESDKNDGE